MGYHYNTERMIQFTKVILLALIIHSSYSQSFFLTSSTPSSFVNIFNNYDQRFLEQSRSCSSLCSFTSTLEDPVKQHPQRTFKLVTTFETLVSVTAYPKVANPPLVVKNVKMSTVPQNLPVSKDILTSLGLSL